MVGAPHPPNNGRNARVNNLLSPRRTGFTLIEMLVVLAIVALLLTLSVPRYFRSLDRTKETILVENLRTTRDAIDKFHADTGRYPNALDELVERKYLRSFPIDPISSAKWVIVPPDPESKGSVYNIKSASPGAMSDGKPYSQQ